MSQKHIYGEREFQERIACTIPSLLQHSLNVLYRDIIARSNVFAYPKYDLLGPKIVGATSLRTIWPAHHPGCSWWLIVAACSSSPILHSVESPRGFAILLRRQSLLRSRRWGAQIHLAPCKSRTIASRRTVVA